MKPPDGNPSLLQISAVNRDNDPLSLMQFVLSALAALIFWAFSLILVIVGLINILNGETIPGGVLQILLAAGAGAATSILLLPSVIFSMGRVTGKGITVNIPGKMWLRPTTLIFALPVVLLIGYLVLKIEYLAWFILPVMHILAIGLPVLLFLYLGERGLQLGSPQRGWGVFDSGLVLGPLLIMFAEILAFGAAAVIGVIILMGQPEFLQELMSQMEWLVNTGPTPEQIVEKMAPLVTQPPVLFVVFVFAAVLVPLIEEALKPIGVWLLAGRAITPVGGFTAGLLSGAGYAFFESLALSSTSEDWIMVVTARAATAVIHIFTTGLMGWAIVSAWKQGKYFKLAMTYLGMVTLHGLWNGITLFTAYTVLAGELVEEIEIPELLSSLGNIAPFALGMITLGSILALVLVNRRLRKSRSLPAGEGISIEITS